jgi:hypothetical protein
MSLACTYLVPNMSSYGNPQVTDAQVQVPLGVEPFAHGSSPVLRLPRRLDRRLYAALQPFRRRGISALISRSGRSGGRMNHFEDDSACGWRPRLALSKPQSRYFTFCDARRGIGIQNPNPMVACGDSASSWSLPVTDSWDSATLFINSYRARATRATGSPDHG